MSTSEGPPFAALKPSRTPPIPSRDEPGPKRCVEPMAVAADGYSEASSWLRLHLFGRGYMTDVVSSTLGWVALYELEWREGSAVVTSKSGLIFAIARV